MENLNAETVKKALASLMADCGKCANERHSECGLFCAAYKIFLSDSDLSTCDERCKDYAPPYIYCVLKDVFALINSQEQRIGELAEEAQTYKKHHDIMDVECSRLEKRNDELTEENERLRAEKHEPTELIIKMPDEEETKKIIAELKSAPLMIIHDDDKIKADTVREMQQLIEEKTDGCDIIPLNSTRPIDTIYQISKKQLDQIAKELLEGKNDT